MIMTCVDALNSIITKFEWLWGCVWKSSRYIRDRTDRRTARQTDSLKCSIPAAWKIRRFVEWKKSFDVGRIVRYLRLCLACSFVQKKNQGKTTIYCASNGCWSTLSTPLHKRPLPSVVLDAGVAEKLLNDLEHFVDHCEWYLARGIPYRRGYLLHGPPGTGKTSFIMALAGLFSLNICILNLSEKWLTDEVFNQLLCNAPQNSVFLLEDVDAAFINREMSDGKVVDASSKLVFLARYFRQ